MATDLSPQEQVSSGEQKAKEAYQNIIAEKGSAYHLSRFE
jgi:hypothetical protein